MASTEPLAVIDVQGDNRWMSIHNAFLQDGKDKEPEVVLIGDSIVQHMTQSKIWKEMFEPLHCVNFGLGGDTTQHVLWRVLNGEMDLVQPKVIVLLVGTNNHQHSADEVADGIMAIAKAIHEKQPTSHLIVVGLLPRGEKPNPLREKNSAVNKRLAEDMEGKPMASFLKVDDKEFVNSEGVIERSVMFDFLHLTSDTGYQRLCDPLLEEIQNLLGTYVKVESTSFDTSSMAGEFDDTLG